MFFSCSINVAYEILDNSSICWAGISFNWRICDNIPLLYFLCSPEEKSYMGGEKVMWKRNGSLWHFSVPHKGDLSPNVPFEWPFNQLVISAFNHFFSSCFKLPPTCFEVFSLLHHSTSYRVFLFSRKRVWEVYTREYASIENVGLLVHQDRMKD